MSDWQARRIVVKGKLRFPDGSEREATYQLVPDFSGHGEGVFTAARVFVCHERKTPHNIRVRTVESLPDGSRRERVEHVEAGSTMSLAGDHFDVPIKAPVAGEPVAYDRLNVVPPAPSKQA